MSKRSGVKGKTTYQLARCTAAAARKAVHGARSPQEQLTVLDDRPGMSMRERTKLAGQK